MRHKPPGLLGASRGNENPRGHREQDGPRLRVLIRVEPVSLLSRLLQGQAGTTTSTQLAFFNVGLAIADERGTLVPDLATALPQLNTDS